MKTTYLEPPIETLYHSDLRGLVRVCLVENGFFLALTVERIDGSGHWRHVKTEHSSSAFVEQEFESLAQLLATGSVPEEEQLPYFVLRKGEPQARRVEGDDTPVEIRDTLLLLLDHHFGIDSQQSSDRSVESLDNVIRVPGWLTALVSAIVVPAIIFIPSWLPF
ncbi:MAG: hypothetical protein RH917_20645 [Lacipirellulaceae bacterium]